MPRPHLVLAAGMARTGSTWLYNAVRYCFLCGGRSVYGAYVDAYEPAIEADVHVVKVHNFDGDLQRGAHIIVTTRRDLRDVAASMVRKGWVSDDPMALDIYLRQTLVLQHDAWRRHSDLEVDYEEIVRDPTTAVRRMVGILAVPAAPEAVAQCLEVLRRTVLCDVDRTTQMWPGHVTDGGIGTYGRTLSPASIAAVERLMRERGE